MISLQVATKPSHAVGPRAGHLHVKKRLLFALVGDACRKIPVFIQEAFTFPHGPEVSTGCAKFDCETGAVGDDCSSGSSRVACNDDDGGRVSPPGEHNGEIPVVQRYESEEPQATWAVTWCK